MVTKKKKNIIIDILRTIYVNLHEFMGRYQVESDKNSINLFKQQFLMHHSYVLFKIRMQNFHIKKNNFKIL